MASIYLASVTGDGLTLDTAFRPIGFDGKPFAVLMIHEAKGKALLVSSDDTVTGVGINNLLTAASMQALRTFAANNNPSAAKRTAMNTWLTSAGYQTLTASEVSWAQCLHYIARQVNPGADLATTG